MKKFKPVKKEIAQKFLAGFSALLVSATLASCSMSTQKLAGAYNAVLEESKTSSVASVLDQNGIEYEKIDYSRFGLDGHGKFDLPGSGFGLMNTNYLTTNVNGTCYLIELNYGLVSAKCKIYWADEQNVYFHENVSDLACFRIGKGGDTIDCYHVNDTAYVLEDPANNYFVAYELDKANANKLYNALFSGKELIYADSVPGLMGQTEQEPQK